jgi:hypothetical protein
VTVHEPSALAAVTGQPPLRPVTIRQTIDPAPLTCPMSRPVRPGDPAAGIGDAGLWRWSPQSGAWRRQRSPADSPSATPSSDRRRFGPGGPAFGAPAPVAGLRSRRQRPASRCSR